MGFYECEIFTSVKEVVFSSLFVCLLACAKTSERICLKFSWKVATEQVIKFWWRFGLPSVIYIQGLFSGFVTIGRYGKWLTDIHLYWFTRWRHWQDVLWRRFALSQCFCFYEYGLVFHFSAVDLTAFISCPFFPGSASSAFLYAAKIFQPGKPDMWIVCIDRIRVDSRYLHAFSDYAVRISTEMYLFPYWFSKSGSKTCRYKAVFVRFECNTRNTTQRVNILKY